jgi:SpoIID/LytB domain protein
VRRKVAVAALVGGLLMAGVAVPAHSEARRRKLGATEAPLRLVARPGTTLSVRGLHDYFGTIELGAPYDGILVVNSLSLEEYLLGLQEVPTDWPTEALRAQAVAARSFALYTISRPAVGDAAAYGFDICASINCQVFSGAEVVGTDDGQRWREAVESTEGQVLLYKGAPILARYHSTSGGQTLDNEDAFEGDPAYPYLKGVASPWETAAPLFRWEVRFALRDLEAILKRQGWWISDFGHLKSVHTVEVPGRHYPDVIYEGKRGSFRSTTDELRSVVRELAPRMFPGLYPSRSPTSTGRLPETFPSERLRIATRAKTVFVLGRGWGHGTGMSQWGAYGLAAQGASYSDILLHYYTAVTLGTFAEPVVDVGVDWGRSSVMVTGDFKIVDARGKTLVPDAIGTWKFNFGGSGVISIDPPRGHGLPLHVGIVDAPREVGIGEAAFLTVALSRPAQVRTVTPSAPTGFDDPGERVKNAGRQEIPWLAPLEEGSYTVRVSARAGPARRVSEAVTIEVRADPSLADEGQPLDERDDSGIPLLVLIAALVAVLALLVGVAALNTGHKNPPRIE